MKSSRPYLIRAIHEWIIDSGLTPYIVIDATYPGVVIPTEYVQDDKIVLNITPEVVHGLVLGNEYIEFKARFSGVPRHISAPVGAVTALYSKENGRGMVFEDEEEHDNISGGLSPDEPPQPPKGKRHLKVVK